MPGPQCSKCGKVSPASAKACTSCGTLFPVARAAPAARAPGKGPAPAPRVVARAVSPPVAPAAPMVPPHTPPPTYAAPLAPPAPPAPPPPPPWALPALAREVSGERWGAAVLDMLVVSAMWIALFMIVYVPTFRRYPWSDPFNVMTDVATLVYRLPITGFMVLSYYAVQDAEGGTIGKRAVGLRVVGVDFGPIGLTRAYERSLELFVWLGLGVIPHLGWSALHALHTRNMTKRGQSFGDQAANCFVVRSSAVGRR